ncbi:MAG: hypothetical protein HQM02_08965 [Magnetococcales bacterium]|nr:hypothetical protein [Magnetococcales bacterium]
MKIKTKLMFALISIALFVATMGWVETRLHFEVEQTIEHLTAVNMKTLHRTTDVVLQLETIRSSIRKLMAEVMMAANHPAAPSWPVTQKELQGLTTVIRERIASLDQALSLWEDEIRRMTEEKNNHYPHQDAVHELKEAFAGIASTASQFILELPTGTPPPLWHKPDLMANHEFFSQEMEPLFGKVQQLSHTLFTHARTELSTHIQSIRDNMERKTRIGWGLTAGSLIAALSLAFVLSRRIATPIELLRDAAISVGKTGKFKMDMPLESKDEIG